MKIVEKYLEAIKTFDDYVTISDWQLNLTILLPFVVKL